MNAIDVLKTRRSIREYLEKPIPKDILEEIVDAARFAPTARNVQPWEFIVITEPGLLKKLSGLAENGRFLDQAKACVAVFCADTKYYLEDGCAATCSIMLAAAGFGVGTCWVAGDKKPYAGQVAGLLGAPGNYRLISLISMGYPKDNDSFHQAQKRDLRELLHWEKF